MGFFLNDGSTSLHRVPARLGETSSLFYIGSKNHIQDSVRARQMLCHWATTSFFKLSRLKLCVDAGMR